MHVFLYLPPTESVRSDFIQDGISQNADAFDFDFADIARLHPKWRFASEPDARGRAGDEQITGRQRDRRADNLDLRGNIENHRCDRCTLNSHAVQPGFEFQSIATIRQLVGSHEDRSERAGAIKILANRPLWCLELIVAD